MKCHRIYLPILLLAFVLATSLSAGTEYPAKLGEAVVPGQLLVRYKSGTAGVSVAATMVPGAQALPLSNVPNVYLVQVPPGAPPYYSTQLSQSPLVEYVEPNRIRHTTLSAPNDSLLSSQWDLTKIQAQQAWQLIPGIFLNSGTAGTGRIKIAVIDTGADCTHPDFKNAGGSSTDAASGGQILFSLSQAIVGTTLSGTTCAAWQDDFGHGTHVSGTIGAATNNLQGVAALGYSLELIEYKAMDNAGNGTDSNLAAAIHAAADAGASIISMSLGEAQYSQTLQDAVNYAWQRNSLVIAAAGNDGVPEMFFPAGANHAMGVASTDSNDVRASSSNTGTIVDIAAPGVGIWSTMPTYSVPLAFNQTSGSYGTLDGTSMATPHVAALAGLIEMATPNLSVAAVAQRIQQSADNTESIANGGWGSGQGYGRINAFRAISGSLRSASVGEIVGQVVTSSGLAVASATVTVNGAAPTFFDTASGLFRSANLAAGNTYTVHASAGSNSANLSVAVVAGADSNATVVLGATTGVFNGTVSDGIVPFSGVVVQALSGGLIKASAVTDSSGDYSLAVPVGTYDIRASAMYAVTTTVPSQTVTASPAVNVPIQMAKMGTISGTVLNASGAPVANSQITITGSGYSAGAVANGGGNFATIPLPAGTYNLTATGTTSTLSGVVVTNDNNTVVTFSQNVTVTTIPAGLQIIVDSATLTAPQTFNWTPGSNHTVNVVSPSTVGGTRGTFASWSDGGAQSHSVTAPASGSTSTFTATFTTEYLLTLTASPANGGTLTPNPTSPTNDGFYPSGTAVQVTAANNTGFTFGNFSGDLSGTTNPQTVTMSAPRSVTANFGAPVSFTVTTSPAGRSFSVDGTPYTSAQVFTWTTGSSHTIAVTSSPQAGSAGTRYAFASWSDGLAMSHSVIAPASTTTYTANFTTQYSLTLAAAPTTGGTLTPSPASPTGDGYYNSGTSVQVTATVNANFSFGGFSGDLTGTTNPQTVAMSAPRSVTGNFAGVVTATVTTNPAGLQFRVDGIQYNLPQTFTNWVPGSSHIVGIITNPQSAGGARNTWANWSDGGLISHSVIAPAGGTSITYTANFNTQYLLTLAASPGGGGALSPNPPSPAGDGYYNSGAPVQVTAIANLGFSFVNFSGDLIGSSNPQSVTMSVPHAVTANFSSGSSGSGPLGGYWRLDEASGATALADASGNGNSGTCAGGTCPTLGVSGKVGSAASFNGTSSRINIPDSPSLRLNQFTVALWVYPRQVKSDFQPLVVKSDSSSFHRNYGLFIVPNTMQVRYAAWAGDCATPFAASSTGQLALNTWNHVAFTYDGAVERLYINGVLDSSRAAATASLCQAVVPVNIGMLTGALLPFNGMLDDIQIYNQPLSAAGVSSLYSPLAAEWKLDERSGAISFADATGNGNAGTCGTGCPIMGVAGKIGTAAAFNGTNSQITVPDSPSLRLNQFTIGVWVYPRQTKTDYQQLVMKADSSGSNRNYALHMVPNSLKVRYSVWAGDCATKFAANSVGQLTLNTWNHVVFTYDGAVEKLYINGILDSSNTAVTASLCQTAAPVNIGMQAPAFLSFNGMLDDIQIYNQALSAAGVSSLYSPLAAEWKLDEFSGATSFADAAGSGNTGACGAACPAMGVPGKAGTAASFNGINSQITIPDSPSLRLNQFTIALWIYPTQVKSDFQPLVVKADSSSFNRNYGLFIVPNTMQVRYSVWASDCATKFAANSAGQLALNTWNYVAFTYDGVTESLYLNGVLDSSIAAATASLCQVAVPVNIGMETAALLPFNGALDDVRIYNQALSAASVSNLYNSF